MKKIITLSILSLTIAGVLNATTVKVGNNIKVTAPGSTSVNVSKNWSVKVNTGKVSSGTKNGNGAASKSGKNISINGTSQTKTITVNGGNVYVSGTENNITIKGNATSITVSGSDNKVYIDSVSQVTVSGVDNKVYYKTSPTKSGKPSISTTGVDNSVSKK